MSTVEITEATPQVSVTGPTGTVNVYSGALAVSAQVSSSDIVLGSADCPVTIYQPNGFAAPTYVEATGRANTALLNTLFANWGTSGAPAGRVILPPGVLHTVGPVIIPRTCSPVFEGSSPRLWANSDSRPYSQGTSEWYMERDTTLFPDVAATATVDTGNPIVITSVAHGLATGDTVELKNFGSSPTINGIREITKTGADTFTVPVTVNTGNLSDSVGTWQNRFCPGIACQTIGPEFHNILLRSRRHNLFADPWVDTEPTAMVYQASRALIDNGAAGWQTGWFAGFGTEENSGLGTGKMRFVSSSFVHGPNTAAVQLGVAAYGDSPADNADTCSFESCMLTGSGPVLNTFQNQAIENIFENCIIEPYSDTPNIANIYRGGGVMFRYCAVVQPCTLVKLYKVSAYASGSLSVDFHNVKVDNNAVPGFKFYDGKDDTTLAHWCVTAFQCHWGLEALASNNYFFKMGANQQLTLRDCTGVQAPLFTTHVINRIANGESPAYNFRTSVKILDCECRVGDVVTPGSLSSLRYATDSTYEAAAGAHFYHFLVSGNRNQNNKPYADADLSL